MRQVSQQPRPNEGAKPKGQTKMPWNKYLITISTPQGEVVDQKTHVVSTEIGKGLIYEELSEIGKNLAVQNLSREEREQHEESEMPEESRDVSAYERHIDEICFPSIGKKFLIEYINKTSKLFQR